MPIGTRSVRLHDALGRGPHPPVLHVEGDAEVLAHDHARGDDLDRGSRGRPAARPPRWRGGSRARRCTTTSPNGRGRGRRARRARRRRSAWSGGAHHGRAGSAPVATMTWSGRARSTSPGHTPTPYSMRHAEPPALGQLVAHQVAELGPVGHRSPPAAPGRRPARSCSNTVTSWPLRAAAMAACRPAGPAPTTTPGAAPGDRAASADAVASRPGARVLDAAEPAVEAHAPDALLVARQAQADVVGGAGAGLGGEVGVGDLAPHHADEVAVALGQRPLGLQRVLEPARRRRPAGRPPCGSPTG